MQSIVHPHAHTHTHHTHTHTHTHSQAINCGIVDRVLTWARAKSQAVISKKQSGSKHTKLRGIPKLDDANDAGSKNSLGCTLIVTEGDSAKVSARSLNSNAFIAGEIIFLVLFRFSLFIVAEAIYSTVRWGA